MARHPIHKQRKKMKAKKIKLTASTIQASTKFITQTIRNSAIATKDLSDSMAAVTSAMGGLGTVLNDLNEPFPNIEYDHSLDPELVRVGVERLQRGMGLGDNLADEGRERRTTSEGEGFYYFDAESRERIRHEYTDEDIDINKEVAKSYATVKERIIGDAIKLLEGKVAISADIYQEITNLFLEIKPPNVAKKISKIILSRQNKPTATKRKIRL